MCDDHDVMPATEPVMGLDGGLWSRISKDSGVSACSGAAGEEMHDAATSANIPGVGVIGG